jgi:crotonobetainyl-CoA:carnitine CoA-transferase CaiB-like acyl-CoA transferase
MNMGALTGLRVLDMSRVLAGPWAGQMLGDLGAEVIKVERPGSGDETRAWGPPYLKDRDGNNTAEAAYFLSANRNKQSVCIDITRSEGQDVLRELATRCDILIENFKVGGLKAYSLDYPSLRLVNPRLIYCSITGFGQTGPYAARAGYDFLIQGMGGLMSITGRRDDEPGHGPQKVGVALTDILTGLNSVVAILAALRHRDLSGRGQHIDMSLLDVQVTSLANQNMNYLTTGKAPVRMGNAHPNIVPYQDFSTKDGSMIIAVGNDSQFAALCKVLGHAEWAQDDKFKSNTLRVKNRIELIELMNVATQTRTTVDWVRACESVGVPCGPINDLDAVFHDPHVIARGLQMALPHTHGSVPQVASPIKMSETPVSYRQAPPMLGEHTTKVLREIVGLSESDVAKLLEAGVIGTKDKL